ncbi:class I SAM-dependent methyltransferase [Hyphomicrobium nitrativorans]|nr:class I SAM-dependent methyltransferase [Hyphomicrobium nitrativorans]
MSAQTANLDEQNIAFWNELCGSNQARVLGIADASPASLKKFDDWFLSFYPYLFLHIPFEELKGKDVLEVGLGYGTIAQRLAESGARYTGLDIASGPVEMANFRIRQAGLEGQAVQGSVLKAPFPDESFDMIVTIGCLHHTGNLQRALDECYRLLRPDGKLMVMLYYAYSYRRWEQARSETLRYWFRERFGYVGPVKPLSDAEKWDYDHNEKGQAAPHTDFVSVRSLRKMTSKFSSFSYRRENINTEPPFQKWSSRRELLKTKYPGIVGLEIYATLTK